jgi:hypothetical protein
MTMRASLIQSYRILQVICLIGFGIWTGLGVYSAIVVYPVPQLAAARIAILGLAIIGILHSLIPTNLLLRWLSTSIALGIVLCGIYIRFTAFPFVYINSELPQDSSVKDSIGAFVTSNAEGSGATSSVWHRSSFKWYASRGSHDLPPLLFPIIVPACFIATNLALRCRCLSGP